MKCISLFVCFFIGLQSVSVSNMDAEIEMLENKVVQVQENQASAVSRQCLDTYLKVDTVYQKTLNQLEEENKDLSLMYQDFKKAKNELDVYRLWYKQDVQCLQRSNSILKGYFIEKEFNVYLKQYHARKQEYLQKKKVVKKLKSNRILYESYLKRIEACQSVLFSRFQNLSGLKNQGNQSKDSMIAGTYDLPNFGGMEEVEDNGISCLVDGSYSMDQTSSFWQNPIDNGTISAGCWAYPNGGLHLGLDIASPMYSNVKAVANGIVLYANNPVDSNNGYLGNWCGWPSGGGNTICMIVSVQEKLYAISYAHLSNEIYVRSGQQVMQGDVLAQSGNSGNSSGPHTHIEVFILKKDLNTTIEYFRTQGADFSFGCGFKEAATCSNYACRIDPQTVLEGI